MRSSWPSLANPTGKWASPSIRGVTLLVSILGGLYATQLFVDRGSFRLLEQHLGLSSGSIALGHLWQVFTYAFLHENPWPFEFIAAVGVLFLAGRELEPILGTGQFLRLTASAALLPGVLMAALFAVGMPSCAVVTGATGIAFGVAVAYSTIIPDLDITLFPLPIRVQARVFTGLAFGLAGAGAIWGLLAQDLNYMVPLAGAFAGWMHVRHLGFGAPTFWQRRKMHARMESARLQRMSPSQFIEEEINPILEKIAREGLSSLSRNERELLRRGREKLEQKTVNSR